METIKVTVNVNVDLSESTKSFIASLFATPAKVAAPTEAPAKVATPTEAPTETPAKVAAPTVSIEDVRSVLAEKINDHRPAIKDKLTELGAPSVTKLDPAKYDEMYNFLKSL